MNYVQVSKLFYLILILNTQHLLFLFVCVCVYLQIHICDKLETHTDKD